MMFNIRRLEDRIFFDGESSYAAEDLHGGEIFFAESCPDTDLNEPLSPEDTSEIRKTATARSGRPAYLLNPIPDQTVGEGSHFSLSIPYGTFREPDGETLHYWSFSPDHHPEWMNFDGRTFSGTPTQADVGTYDIIVLGTDGDFLGEADIFRVTVANVNDAPELSEQIPAQTATQHSPFIYTVPSGTFYDADGDRLTLIAYNLPGWLSFDGRTFSGTPESESDNLASMITVRASDISGAFADCRFSLTVLNFNDPAYIVNPISDQTVGEGSRFSLSIPSGTFREPDGETLHYWSFSPDHHPEWMNFDGRTFSGMPTQADVGNYDIIVLGTDGDFLGEADIFRVTVLNVNDAPELSEQIPAQTATQHSSFVYTVPSGTFYDADGDRLTLTVYSIPGWLSFDGRTFSGTPESESDNLTSAITVRASDTSGTFADCRFSLTVLNFNDPAYIVNPILDQTVGEGSHFSFSIPVGTFAEPDGENLYYWSFSPDHHPEWMSFDGRTFSGTPTHADVGKYDIIVLGTDSEFLGDAVYFTVTVTASIPPVIEKFSDGRINYSGSDWIKLDSGQDAVVSDGDNINFSGGEFRLVCDGMADGDEFRAPSTLGEVEYTEDGFRVSLGGTASPESVAEFIRNIEFRNISSFPSFAFRKINIILKDGTGGIYDSRNEV